MAVSPILDLDLLRTLTLVAEEGSFTRAAERVGRTQSAVSLQIQRLEGLVGHPVLARSKGGRVEPTAKGRVLLDYAAKLLALNDEVFDTIRSPDEPSAVRLGAPENNVKLLLPQVLARFSQAYPDVTVEIVSAPSCQLVPMLKAGTLDLMLCEGGHEPRQWPAVELWRAPLRWVGSENHEVHRRDPLPLSLSPGDCPWRPAWLSECIWRGAALKSLERAGRRYKVVSTSSTVAGQQAAALAGLAVTVSTTAALVQGLRELGAEDGLPSLPHTTVLLLEAREPRQPVTATLAAHLVDAFAAGMQDRVPDGPS